MEEEAPTINQVSEGQTSYSGFEMHQENALTRLQEALGFVSPISIKKVDDFEIDKGRVAGFYSNGTLCLTEATIERTHPKAMIRTVIHELAHAGSAFLNPDVTDELALKRQNEALKNGSSLTYNDARIKQEKLIKDSEEALDNLTSLFTSSGKYLNGYHRYVTERYLEYKNDPEKAAQNQYGIVNSQRLKEEVLAITVETLITNPKKIQVLEQSVSRSLGKEVDFDVIINKLVSGLTYLVDEPSDVPNYLENVRESLEEIMGTFYNQGYENHRYESVVYINSQSHFPPSGFKEYANDSELSDVMWEIIKIRLSRDKKPSIFDIRREMNDDISQGLLIKIFKSLIKTGRVSYPFFNGFLFLLKRKEQIEEYIEKLGRPIKEGEIFKIQRDLMEMGVPEDSISAILESLISKEA